ncbi:cytochrome C oxidase subunit IV family protein [Roseibacillus ishigakijimensis]|uniref:Cytochrome C oxidase subunit IV family protein n=1 Tax=Roseibacillus ishigakijimensis TaxID=454146 RepID=A0A934VLP6_9BACT|nr:cytochrome C oxidase subunit IV family protein [Roseibacillus ishigakijimensis]MBK1834904.1 cytochrome C oxidase subunit IV family protein [Roseibacillus ishigakijimensis]
MADSPAEIKKAQKLYLLIGLTLFFFTVITVAVATVEALDFGGRGFDHVDAIIGLLIATFKASLVMLIFMHLNHEKKLVYFLYAMAIVFGICLMGLTGWAFEDPIEYGQGTTSDKTGFYDPTNTPED